MDAQQHTRHDRAMSMEEDNLFPQKSITTNRLRLRLPRLSDAAAIYEGYATCIDITRYLMWSPHESLESTQCFLKAAIEAWTVNAGERDWVIEEIHAERPVAIGMIGITVSSHSVEVGYVLGASYQSRGYMTEALSVVTGSAFSDPAIHRIYATCHVDNTVSRRVLERCGYELEGRLRRYARYPNCTP